MLAKIAVLVSGGGTNLQALLDAQGKKLKHGEIKAVISNHENAYALRRAEKYGVPAYTIKNENEIIQIIEENKIDLIILAGFLSILSKDFTKRYTNRILNIHPSLIPSFCGKGYYGLKVHEAALAYGVKITGATVHFVNEIPDGGKIIDQKAVRVHKGDTPEKLQRRVMEKAEWILLPRATEAVCKNILKEKTK